MCERVRNRPRNRSGFRATGVAIDRVQFSTETHTEAAPPEVPRDEGEVPNAVRALPLVPGRRFPMVSKRHLSWGHERSARALHPVPGRSQSTPLALERDSRDEHAVSLRHASLRRALLGEDSAADPYLDPAIERAARLEVTEDLIELDTGDGEGVFALRLTEGVSADPAQRPLRGGTLRDLLDAEFQRCHRFDTISTFFGDLRSLLRKAVARETDEDLEVDEFERRG